MAIVNEKPTLVPIDKLELDPENPRLPASITGKKESAILEYLARTASIEELMEAIGKNGYFVAEPVLAYRPDKKKNIYRVIEGNRRLTAVKLLTDPSQLPKRTKLKEIADSAKHIPKEIPVIEFDKRNDVLVYLGYRHVTGVKQWEPLAKARYLYQLFQQFHTASKRQGANKIYREVAKSIGTNPAFVRRALDSYVLYREMEDEGFYDIDGLNESTIDFSLLSTSLGYENFRDFLELEDDLALAGPKNRYNPNRLKLLTSWLFEKTSTGKSRLGDSRNIRKLNLILNDAGALRSFQKGASIDGAYRMTVGAGDDFLQLLHSAHDSLMQANGLRADITVDNDAKDLIKKISRQVDALRAAS